MGKLDGKAAVITGGASGIGAATTRLFAREGARVVIADVQDAAGEALATELGASALYQHVDVSRGDDVRDAVARAMAAFGRLDCMFNNAGILGTVGPLEDIPVEEYDRTMAVLLRSVFLGMKYAATVMKAQGSGSIISTSSIAGIIGGDGPHIYSTAKAAVIHLTKSAALELGPHGVRVNCICPGGILTPMATGSPEASPQVNEAVAGVLAGFQPIPRAGMPDDIAQAALWLASDDATFVSGHALVVDGAATAGTPWQRQPVPFRTHRPMP
jgi:NAD(P)-dependent dehydrogenase (short-subunit alcohol dehydrogenase family)